MIKTCVQKRTEDGKGWAFVSGDKIPEIAQDDRYTVLEADKIRVNTVIQRTVEVRGSERTVEWAVVDKVFDHTGFKPEQKDLILAQANSANCMKSVLWEMAEGGTEDDGEEVDVAEVYNAPRTPRKAKSAAEKDSELAVMLGKLGVDWGSLDEAQRAEFRKNWK